MEISNKNAKKRFLLRWFELVNRIEISKENAKKASLAGEPLQPRRTRMKGFRICVFMRDLAASLGNQTVRSSKTTY